MKRQFIALLFVLTLLSPYHAFASAETDAVRSDIVTTILDWTNMIATKSDNNASSDLTSLIDALQDTLNTATSVFLLPTATDADSVAFHEPSLTQEERIFHSGTCYVESLNVYCEAEVQYDTAYLIAKLSMYEPDGTLIGIQRVELGVREEEFMALLVDFDHATGLTGRFAMYPQDNDPRIIFTKTIGKTLDICLDVRAWTEGTDYSEWSKSLLLPAAVLYQAD